MRLALPHLFFLSPDRFHFVPLVKGRGCRMRHSELILTLSTFPILSDEVADWGSHSSSWLGFDKGSHVIEGSKSFEEKTCTCKCWRGSICEHYVIIVNRVSITWQVISSTLVPSISARICFHKDNQIGFFPLIFLYSFSFSSLMKKIHSTSLCHHRKCCHSQKVLVILYTSGQVGSDYIYIYI